MGQWPILPEAVQSKGPHRSGEGLLNGSNRHDTLGGGYNVSRRLLRSVISLWLGFVADLGPGHDLKWVLPWPKGGFEYLRQDEAGRPHLICNADAIIL
jgi:hypothetical protein